MVLFVEFESQSEGRLILQDQSAGVFEPYVPIDLQDHPVDGEDSAVPNDDIACDLGIDGQGQGVGATNDEVGGAQRSGHWGDGDHDREEGQ